MQQSRPQHLTVAGLASTVPGLVHGFTGNLGAVGEHGAVDFARVVRGVVKAQHGAEVPVYAVRQIHSARLVRFPGSDSVHKSGPWPPGDGIILEPGQSGIAAIQTADCVPILAANLHEGGVAALHAGWRGVAAGILPNLLTDWLAGDTPPAEVCLALGPSIGACCYQVQADCLDAFAAADREGAVGRVEGSWYLHLGRVLRNQALRFGLPASSMHTVALCTYCTSQQGMVPYASYRRSGRPPAPFAERNASYIGFLAEQKLP